MSAPQAWSVIGASVAGSRHVDEGRSCEDHHGHRVTPDGLIAVVADGAGSADRGGRGAQLAIDAVLKAHQDLVRESELEPCSEAGVNRILAAARRALEDVASKEDRSTIRDFATTLSILVVGNQEYVTACVGDSPVFVRNQQFHLQAVAKTPAKRYLNETDFLTQSNWKEVTAYARGPSSDATGFALMTDGLELVATDLSTGEPYAPFFDPIFEFALSPNASVEKLAAFLREERFSERTDDDRTLVIGARLD